MRGAAQTAPVIRAPVANGTYLALGDSLAFGYQARVGAASGPRRLIGRRGRHHLKVTGSHDRVRKVSASC